VLKLLILLVMFMLWGPNAFDSVSSPRPSPSTRPLVQSMSMPAGVSLGSSRVRARTTPLHRPLVYAPKTRR
jgi:hypothetical protein